MENPAQWSFHALRAHFDLCSTHLSCRATWLLLDGPPSWRQRGRPQPIDEAEDYPKQLSRHRNLGQLESSIATIADNLGADVDQLLPYGEFEIEPTFPVSEADPGRSPATGRNGVRVS